MPLRNRSSRDEAETRSETSAAAEPEPRAPDAERDLGKVADHVRTVLAAAESAAEKLRTEAEHEAQRVRQQAAKAAHDLREQAAAEADADRSEARRQLARVKEEARGIRHDADTYAEGRKHDADAQAMRVIREAEHRAGEIASAAAERHQVLLNDIAFSENRMREFAASLREVATRLEEVADASAGGPRADEAEEALDAALNRRVVDETSAETAVIGERGGK
jgi:hypothetical protein